MLFMGKCIRRIKGKRNQYNKIGKILINRSDRLGDAFISLPFIILLSKKYKVTVLTSSYNDFIFKNAHIDTIPFNVQLIDQNRENIISKIKRFFVIKKIAINTLDFDAYLNFSGYNNVQFNGKGNIFKIGYTFGLSPLLHDDTVATFHNQNHAKSIHDMILKIDPTFNYQPDIINYDFLKINSDIVNRYNYSENFIVIHVGGKESRLVNKEYVVSLLNTVSYKTLVIDSQDNLIIKSIKNEISNPNIEFCHEQLGLFEIYTIISNPKCQWFIGYDTGSSHLLQMPVNAVIIYTVGDPDSWKPYTVNNEWGKKVYGSVVVENNVINNKRKYVIYNKVPCRPCFDLICKKPICKNLDISIIDKLIK